MIHKALHDTSWRELDYLFIENVGNLVCPAIYDLGQDANVVALAVTEGEDKPLKYPVMFRAADLVLITKIDLLPHLTGIALDRIVANLEQVMPTPMFLAVSAQSGEGIDSWMSWLDAKVPRERATTAVHRHHHHHHHHHGPSPAGVDR